MVQATEARHGDHLCGRGGLPLDGPLVRGILIERVVNTVLMVIAHVITMSRSKCRSFSAMTWSRISRRQLPTHLSAVPFCQGDWMLVRFGSRPVAFSHPARVGDFRLHRSTVFTRVWQNHI